MQIKRSFLAALCVLCLCAGVGRQADAAGEIRMAGSGKPGSGLMEAVDKGLSQADGEKPEEETSKAGSVEPLTFYEAGDVVGFIGDSITHVEYSSINYVEFLYNYYLSRFPNREVEFRNLGVSSYKASDILDIYDRDPAFRNLGKAVIMLGMNEALQGVPTETYITNMGRLVERLKEDGMKGEDILVLAPTPYDQTCSANFDANGNPYRMTDNALTEYTEQLAVKTQEWGVHYVDLHTPMLELTQEIQKESTDNTLTVWDCVHPNAMGQMVMAYHILKAQGADPTVSELLISQDGETESKKGEVTDFYRGEKGLCWNWKPECLPMAMTFEFQEFDQLFDLVGELNLEILQIQGLEEDGSYRIAMDKEEVGVYSGAELAAGVNLAVPEANPQQMMMQFVELQNQKWHENSAQYRKIVRFATMAEPTHTMAQMKEAYEDWKEEDIRLRNEMYDMVQDEARKTYHVTVTPEGGSAEELEQDAALALRQAAEEAARKDLDEKKVEEPAKVQVKSNSGQHPIFLILLAAAGVMVLAAIVATVYLLRRRK